jgi:hypothetical protein
VRRQAIFSRRFTLEPAAEVTLYVARRDPGLPHSLAVFQWFRSGRLVGELSVLVKRRHPEVQAEIDRVYQEHLAKLAKKPK